MSDNRKDKQISFLVGVIIGMLIGGFVTAVGGVFAYKVYKRIRQDSRYEFKAPPAKKSKAKAASAMKEFYLSYEKEGDLDVLQPGENASAEISQSNATDGKHSLMVKIGAGSGFPGIGWEVYGRQAQDWSRAKEFHFDVYNNTEDYITLEVKFKSGRSYPKKSYSCPVNLEPLKMNKISIPIANIAQQCDVTQISYVRIFANSPSMDMVLFFDNVGIRQDSQEEEKADTEDKATEDTAQITDKAESKDGHTIFIASSLDRIFQDGKTLTKPNFSRSADISMAKNEFESFQVVISNGKNTLQDVWLEISDLVDESSQVKIDKRNIVWRVVGYVPTKKPYYPVKFVGSWPDPLIPAEKTDVREGKHQPFWVTVYIPKDAHSAVYKADIKVLAEGKELAKLPLSIKVYDFALAPKSRLKTAFDFYGHITGTRYPKRENENEEAYQRRIALLNQKYIIDMLIHRINPILNIDPSSEGELSLVENLLGLGLNNFSIGRRGGTFSNNWPESDDEIEKLLSFYRAYAETLKFNKLFDYHYIYTWDEGKIGDPRAAKIFSMIHRADPKLKNMVCNHGFWDPRIDPEWGKDIDIWCFQIDSFNESKMRALKDLGKEIWMYVSGPSGMGSPNLAIDFDSIDYRILAWLCWKYDIKGLLYWSVNWWPFVDPFKSAANTKWEQNGNGLLFYPGADGPIDSLRLEIFRDGMEDYEYLSLLAKEIKEVEDKNLAGNNQNLITKAKDLLEIDKTLISSPFSFTKDTQMLYKRRNDIAEMMEELKRLSNSKKHTEEQKTTSVIEDFSETIEAVDGKSFGKYGQLTFEVFRNGTFFIDGESGFAWQKSDSYKDAAIIRSTKPLPKTYKISAIVGDIDYGLEKITGLQNDPEYDEGPLNENGAYLLAITDEPPTEHYTNDWWHEHRKVCIDVDNNAMGVGMPHPIFMVYFDKQNRLGALNGKENKWQKDWVRAVNYAPDAWYKVEIEKTESSYKLYVYDAEGQLLKGGVVPFRYVWHEDGNHPDYLVIGEPHENYYQGSMKIKSITMPVEIGK